MKKQSIVKVWSPSGTAYMGDGELTENRDDAAVFPSKGIAKGIAKSLKKLVRRPAKVKIEKIED